MSTAICVSLFVVSGISEVALCINEGKLVSGKCILHLFFLHYGGATGYTQHSTAVPISTGHRKCGFSVLHLSLLSKYLL